MLRVQFGEGGGMFKRNIKKMIVNYIDIVSTIKI